MAQAAETDLGRELVGEQAGGLLSSFCVKWNTTTIVADLFFRLRWVFFMYAVTGPAVLLVVWRRDRLLHRRLPVLPMFVLDVSFSSVHP